MSQYQPVSSKTECLDRNTGELNHRFIFIHGNLNSAKHLELLENEIIPTVRQLPINFDDVGFNRLAVQVTTQE